ncbi:hypothetical protein [Longimicrobium sp.]|uniref:hypothetical protein n=1 Tax=Longimicrobium sp. TaxID=2029185 RepID=UPI003B3A96B3
MTRTDPAVASPSAPPAGRAAFDAFLSYSHSADGQLAPRVQEGLQRLARHPLRPRALRVFRDKTGLAATPELWPDIQRALDQSRYFILMASPQAAASEWVGKEIDHWLTRSPAAARGDAAKRILIVQTEGEIHWDDETDAFNATLSTALPARLHGGVFPTEPLWVDLRDARSREDLSLRNAYFRGKVADLAAPIHGKSKDELIGEDVRIARRNVRVAWAVAVLLLVLATTASWMALQAVRQRDRARSREWAARAVAMLDVDPRQSLRLAVEAVGIDRTPEAVAALRESLIHSTLRAELVPDSGGIILSGALSPDGARVLAAVQAKNGGRYLQLWDAASGRPGCRIGGAEEGGFTAGGEHVVTASGPPVDVRTCQPDAAHPREVAPGDAPVRVVGEWWRAQEVRDARSGALLVAMPEGADPLAGAVLSPGGGWLVTWADKAAYGGSGGGLTDVAEKFARVWRLEKPGLPVILSGHLRAVNAAVFSPGPTLVVTGSDDRTARVWSPTGDELAVLRGHAAAVRRVAISRDGARVLTVAADGRARVWEPGMRNADVSVSPGDLFRLRYGAPLPELQGGEQPRGMPVRSRDGTLLVARLGPARLGVWDAAGRRVGGADLAPLVSHPSAGLTEDLEARLTSDGLHLLVPPGDRGAAAGGPATLVVQTTTGRVVGRYDHRAGTEYTAAYSPDGKQVATGGDGGTVVLFDVAVPARGRVLAAGDARVFHVAFSPDGSRLVTASRDAAVRVWNVRTGAMELELFGHEAGVLRAFFSPDGALVVSIGLADGVRVWDAASGRMLGRYAGRGAEPAFLTPDCGTLVVGEAGPETGWAHLHPFGACGSVDAMAALARRRM